MLQLVSIYSSASVPSHYIITTRTGSMYSTKNCTSSLWKSFNGSTTRPSSRSCLMSSLSLWCVLITSALPLARCDADSIRSGLKVPCPRNTSSGFRFSSDITSFATYSIHVRTLLIALRYKANFTNSYYFCITTGHSTFPHVLCNPPLLTVVLQKTWLTH